MFKLLHSQIPPSTRPETLLVSKVAEGKIRLEIWTVVGLLAAFSLGSSSQAQTQESISIENASATGEAVPVEDSATSLEPISGDDAALDSNGATEVAGFSEEVQKRFLPEALAIRLAIGGIYDDNIFQTRVREESDVVLQGQIGILLRTPKEAKSQLALNYDATSFWYLDHPRLDAVNHAVSLNGTMELGRTQLVMSGNYQRVAGGEQALLQRSVSSSASSNDTTSGVANQNSSIADREVGQYSVRDIVAGSLSISRELGAKTRINSGVNFSGTYYEDEAFQDSQDLSARLGLSYQITGKTALGLAAVYGQLKNDRNATQTYQKLLLTTGYNATGKLTFNGEAGVEFRQYGRRVVQQQVIIPAETPTLPTAPVAKPGPAPAASPAAPAASPGTPPGASPGSASIAMASADPSAPEPASAPAAEDAPPEEAFQSGTGSPTPANDYTTVREEFQEEDTTRFVFNLQAGYQIGIRTALRLGASRSTEGSAIAGGTSIERTTVSLGLDQGLGRRFAVGLSGGYEQSLYGSTDVSQTYWFGRATLNFQPTPTSSIGLFYEHRDNDAGENGLTYEGNRIGVQCSLAF